MRDPKRLKNFYEEMWFLHMQVPDLRFGQLMCNVFKDFDEDVFYMEDKELLDKYKNYFNKILNSTKREGR